MVSRLFERLPRLCRLNNRDARKHLEDILKWAVVGWATTGKKKTTLRPHFSARPAAAGEFQESVSDAHR
jgi:hypothetical protein